MKNKKVYYKCEHTDEDVKKNSSSGGAFTAISDYIITEKFGVVYGCVLNEKFDAVHIRTEDKQGRNLMRGSKYIESHTENVYDSVKDDLSSKRYVLFSGTPCQISALNKYLELYKINTDNLLTVEVICHGVGSNRFFKDHIKYLENKYKGEAVSCSFRRKKYPGQKQDMEVKFNNGKQYNSVSTKYDWFYSVYLKNLILRPSCYHCAFACDERFADISIADFWKKNCYNDYSLLIVNTQKGDSIFKEICSCLNFAEVNESEVHQPHMHHPCEEPKKRKEFWEVYFKYGYLGVQKWMGNTTFKTKIIVFLVTIARKTNIINLLRSVRSK